MISATTFGFLTILEDPEVGFFGGYLVVNDRARPVEFHCTAPILPSRAEEILYGSTLRPHLFCERIGAGLLAKGSAKVSLILVNQLDTWPLADDALAPVVMVSIPAESSAADSPTPRFSLDRVDPALHSNVETQLAALERYVSLSEPFGRIAEALQEAGRIGPPTEVPRDQAA